MIRKNYLIALGAVWTLAVAWTPAFGADLKSPQLVKTSLQIFAGVYDDMNRKLAAKTYDRLPHENQEFQDGAAAMRDAIAGEPAEFKSRVESVLQKTLAASTHVAEVSKTHDESQVRAALNALADSMKMLAALFPENLRPVAGAAGHHEHG